MICGIALFCDDVREEKGGTVTVIGILPDNITVEKAPFTFAKLAIYGRFNFPVAEDPPKKITLRLIRPDNAEMALATFDAELIRRGRDDARKNGAIKTGLISTAIIAPFPVKQAGRMSVMMKVDDGEESVCGSLNIQVEKPD